LYVKEITRELIKKEREGEKERERGRKAERVRE